jgi:hypothetical protein
MESRWDSLTQANAIRSYTTLSNWSDARRRGKTVSLISSVWTVSAWPFWLLASAQASKEALLVVEAEYPFCEVDRLTTAAANDSFLNGKGS